MWTNEFFDYVDTMKRIRYNEDNYIKDYTTHPIDKNEIKDYTTHRVEESERK